MSNSLSNIKAVFKREFLAYFNSPVAYVIVVIFLLATMGLAFFFGNFLRENNASLTQAFFFWHPWIYFIIVPALGMRLWAEEHRLGTIELLLTMPVTPWQAIIGKFVAAALVCLVSLILTFSIVFTVFYLGDPDPGPIISGYVASYCYALACLAVTSACSALTRNQVVCFIVSVFICFVLTLIGYPPIKSGVLATVPTWLEWLVNVITYTSFMDHFYDLTKGIVSIRDILYFVSVVAIGLVITEMVIRTKRA